GAAVTEARHRLLDEHLGARVDVAGRFVEDEDARIGEERAGDSDELPLACRDVRGFFFEKRVVALGQRAYERIDVGGCRCGDDLVQRGASFADAMLWRVGPSDRQPCLSALPNVRRTASGGRSRT